MPAALQDRESLIQDCFALWTQGFRATQISEKTGVNANTVQGWAKRQNWTKTRTKLKHDVDLAVYRAVSESSSLLRDKLANELQESADILAEVPKEKSIKDLAARAPVLEALARAGKAVHDWGNTDKPGLVRASRYVEIESSCVPDTTSPSVPVETPLEQKTLEHKPQ